MRIDAHVHLPVGVKAASLAEKKERLLKDMTKHGVEKCIVISDSELQSEIGSMDECVELFETDEAVWVVAGISPLIAYDTQKKKLIRYLQERKVVGIKLFTGHEKFYLTDQRLEELYEIALQFDVPVLFHSGWEDCQYSDVSLVMELAQKYPKLKLVCCHCFYPRVDKCIQLLNYKNVFFDLSSVADDKMILPTISEAVRILIEAAPARVLFGSDYSGCSQRGHIEFVRSLGLEEELLKQFFSENAMQLYGVNAK